jgi:hypothetical protein
MYSPPFKGLKLTRVCFLQVNTIDEYINDHCVHIFECDATHCMGKGNGRMVHQYLDTGDTKSMSNFCKHVKIGWGEAAITAADNTRDI